MNMLWTLRTLSDVGPTYTEAKNIVLRTEPGTRLVFWRCIRELNDCERLELFVWSNGKLKEVGPRKTVNITVQGSEEGRAVRAGIPVPEYSRLWSLHRLLKWV